MLSPSWHPSPVLFQLQGLFACGRVSGKMLNVLILGHSFVENVRMLCDSNGKPHKWQDPNNCRGKVSVHFNGYPGGAVSKLTTAVEAGLFLRYLPDVVICQIGGNDCKQIT